MGWGVRDVAERCSKHIGIYVYFWYADSIRGHRYQRSGSAVGEDGSNAVLVSKFLAIARVHLPIRIEDEMSVVRSLEHPVEVEAKLILIVVAAARNLCNNTVPVGEEVVWRLDLGCILGWRVLEIFDGRLPVDVRPDRIKECCRC